MFKLLKLTIFVCALGAVAFLVPIRGKTLATRYRTAKDPWSATERVFQDLMVMAKAKLAGFEAVEIPTEPEPAEKAAPKKAQGRPTEKITPKERKAVEQIIATRNREASR
jgi:hypothetical protein